MIRIAGLISLTQRSALLKVSSDDNDIDSHASSVPRCIGNGISGVTKRMFTEILIEQLPKQCKLYHYSFQELMNGTVKKGVASGEPTATTFIIFSGLEHVDITTELFIQLDEILSAHNHLAIICYITSELIPYTLMRLFDIYEDLSLLSNTDEQQSHKLRTQLSAKLRERPMTTDQIDRIPIHPKLTDTIYGIVMNIQSTIFYHNISMLSADGEDGAPETVELTPVKLDLYLIRIIEHWARAIAYYETLLNNSSLRAVVISTHVSEACKLVLTHKIATVPLTELTLDERERMSQSFRYLHRIRGMLESIIP